jgi:hypothetical protein
MGTTGSFEPFAPGKHGPSACEGRASPCERPAASSGFLLGAGHELAIRISMHRVLRHWGDPGILALQQPCRLRGSRVHTHLIRKERYNRAWAMNAGVDQGEAMQDARVASSSPKAARCVSHLPHTSNSPFVGQAKGDGRFERLVRILKEWLPSAQPVDATFSAKIAAGVRNSSVARGRVFRLLAARSRSRCVCTDRSVPFGKY